MVFMGNFLTTIDLSRVGKIMITKVTPLKKHLNPVCMDPRLALIQFLCLRTPSVYHFSLKSIQSEASKQTGAD